MTIVIRAATPLDLESIDAIEKESFGDPWSLQSFRTSLSRSFVRTNIAEDEQGVAGYSVVWMSGEECELANLAVEPSRRGRGIGARLLEAAIAQAIAEGVVVMFLEVRASNAAARELYTARGFREVGRRVRYYKNPEEDALVLRRDLG